MFLQEKNLIIRNATVYDDKLLRDWWNDGRIMEHAGFSNGLGITEQAIIESISKDNDNIYRRLILEVSGIPVGEMSFKNIGDSCAQIGIKICVFDKQDKEIL